MQVEVMPPAGSFTTTYEESQEPELFFIGGGSGITPLFSITKTVLQQEPKSSITLIYGNRDVDSIIFKDELETLQRENSQLRVIHILEKNDTGYAQYSGIPDDDLMQKIIKEQGILDASEIFICGPAPMMNAFQRGLKTAGIQNEKIHIESFAAQLSDNADADHSKTSEVFINILGETHHLHLNQAKPILEQVLDLDIDMPYSCKNGTCSTCRCLLKSGEVSTDKAEGLTEEEIADGYVLICVGRPLSDRVELALG
jgi:ring-1,2-phenylacetyl-CoA epoxidase subunit PaaE